MLHVGLIGVGGIARRHLEAYRTHPQIASLSAADANADTIASAGYDFRTTTADYRDLLSDNAITVVDICLPHHLHAPAAIAAFEAGKDVIMEKPLARTEAEARPIVEAAHRAGKRLFVSMNQCFFPYHVKAKELIDTGEIGRPFMAVFNIMGNEFLRMNQADHWKGTWDLAGGGAMIDTGYHALYTMIRFFGMPTAVMAAAKRLLVEPDNKADDNTAVILEWEGRMLGTISISYTVGSEPWSEHRYIYGSEGSIHLSDEVECPIRLFKEGQSVAVEVEKSAAHPHAVSVAKAVSHFIDCLVAGAEPMVTWELAMQATRLMDAIYESARAGRRVGLGE